MAYLRAKGNYWYLVHGIRDPDTGRCKQKNIKYYGTEKPSEDQVQQDIQNLDALIEQLTGGRRRNRKVEGNLGTTIMKAPTTNFRVSKTSLVAIIGTKWRNKQTHTLYTISKVVPVEPGFKLVGDDEDSYMVWVKFGEMWEKAMSQWYRVDHLTIQEQLEGYRNRVGWCKASMNHTRKILREHQTMPLEKRDNDATYVHNLKVFEKNLKLAQDDYDKALAELDAFASGIQHVETEITHVENEPSQDRSSETPVVQDQAPVAEDVATIQDQEPKEMEGINAPFVREMVAKEFKPTEDKNQPLFRLRLDDNEFIEDDIDIGEQRIHYADMTRKGARLTARCRVKTSRSSCRELGTTAPEVNCKNCLRATPKELLTDKQKEIIL